MNKKNHAAIVVRKKKGNKHGGHHGGSWKIAYADFMTAMMAFFLVMWLLSTSSAEEREQIAEYFKMPLSMALAHGNKSSMSSSIIPGGGDDVVKQEGEELRKTLDKLDQKKRNDENLSSLMQKLQSLIKQDPRLSNFQSNLRLSLTDNGLLVQITDSQDRPMFKIGSREPEPYMRAILAALAPALNELPNRITISGHTDSLPYANGDAAYSNWELSADRANASRRALIQGGLSAGKFLRIVGMADSVSVYSVDHSNPLNRRITILVHSKKKESEILNEDALLNQLTSTPDSAQLKSQLTIQPVDANRTGRAADTPEKHQEQTRKDGHN
ncbi:flagellar motor protein MotB [Pantoea sp. KPR_PJ]|uniref:flagellar motor protein MotB n=1 Tax=Pantoea sp. KPR_PJ TaxID=2738375 RepID=UPI0035271EA5